MKNILWIVCRAGIAAFLLAGCSEQPGDRIEPLNTGRAISPRFHAAQAVGSWPMNLITSPDGKFVVSTDMGSRQSLWAIQTADGKGVSHVDFSNRAASGKSTATPKGETATKADQTAAGTVKSNGLYYGLAFSKDHLLYAGKEPTTAWRCCRSPTMGN